MTITEQAVKQGFITIAAASKQVGISVQGMRKKLKIVPLPGYFVKLGTRYFINPKDVTFKLILPILQKKNNVVPKVIKEKPSIIEDDIETLKVQAVRAKYSQEIQKYDLNNIALEKKRIELKLQAGDIVETTLAEFIFIGYLEKLNRELLAMPKRIIREVGLIVKDGIYTKEDEKTITTKMMKVVDREIEVILRDVKKQQKKDITNWRDSL